MWLQKPTEKDRFTITIKYKDQALRAEAYLTKNEAIGDVATLINSAMSDYMESGVQFAWKPVRRRAKRLMQVIQATVVIPTLVALVAFVAPSQAQVLVRDNLGNESVYSEAEGDSIGTGEVINGFNRHNWDLFFALGVSGSNNDSGSEENLLAGFGGSYYLGNASLGFAMSKPDVAYSDYWSFSPELKMYMWRDPNASWNKGLLFIPLSWNVATGENAPFQGGAWNVNPTLSGFVEWPLGYGAIMLNAGVDYVMTAFSEDVPDGWGSLQAGGRFIWWWVR